MAWILKTKLVIIKFVNKFIDSNFDFVDWLKIAQPWDYKVHEFKEICILDFKVELSFVYYEVLQSWKILWSHGKFGEV